MLVANLLIEQTPISQDQANQEELYSFLLSLRTNGFFDNKTKIEFLIINLQKNQIHLEDFKMNDIVQTLTTIIDDEKQALKKKQEEIEPITKVTEEMSSNKIIKFIKNQALSLLIYAEAFYACYIKSNDQTNSDDQTLSDLQIINIIQNPVNVETYIKSKDDFTKTLFPNEKKDDWFSSYQSIARKIVYLVDISFQQFETKQAETEQAEDTYTGIIPCSFQESLEEFFVSWSGSGICKSKYIQSLAKHLLENAVATTIDQVNQMIEKLGEVFSRKIKNSPTPQDVVNILTSFVKRRIPKMIKSSDPPKYEAFLGIFCAYLFSKNQINYIRYAELANDEILSYYKESIGYVKDCFDQVENQE